MRSQPEATESERSRNPWAATSVRSDWLLAVRALSLVGGVWYE